MLGAVLLHCNLRHAGVYIIAADAVNPDLR